MSSRAIFRYISFFIVFLICSSTFAQNIKNKKMEQLEFLVGEWIGTSKIYENGVVSKQGPAFEKISYDLEKSILVIELNSEFLQLRTIVTYNQTNKKYYFK